MNRLTINHGSFNLDEIDLDHGTVTIGRATDNDIRLDDSAVSSHHAKIVTFFNVTYIEDLDSTNGTIVNGRVIKKYTLHTGDIVLLGKHQLLFHGSPAPEANANSDSTVVMSPSDVKKAMANKPEQAAPVGGVAPAVSPPPAAPIPATAAAIAEPDIGVNVTSAPEMKPSPAPMTAAHVAEAELRPIAPQKPPLGRIEPSTPPSMPTPPPAAKATPVEHTPTPAAVTPKRPVVENMPQIPTTADDLFNPAPLNSLEQHNEAFSLLNDNEDDLKIGKTPFTAFESDESLLIPAFIKSDKTSLNKPTAKKPVPKAVPPTAPPPMRANPPPVTPMTAEPAAVVPKAPKRKQVKKVLEDPSVSFGDPIQHSAPMGINEIDRVNLYREKSDATNPGIGMPAVGDRTLLKQIITGDSSFTTSKNKFEIVQIVLGFVIFAIIALIAFASF